MSGTFRSLVKNLVTGVSEGFEKKLELQGVGYRAQAQGIFELVTRVFPPSRLPSSEGIDVETPSQTQILVKGMDKQRVGQVSAEIRAFRPPEPYKGKAPDTLTNM